MSHHDLEELRRVLREAVRARRMPTRELERALGITHGSLERLLDGRQEIRVRHLLAFARVLRVPAADFLELGCPESARTAEFRLADWLRPQESTPRSSRAAEPAAAAPAALPATAEELATLIRAAVQQELAAHGIARPAGGKPAR
jgi:transcriptional regulator with XRE-family HTH domain